MKYRIREVVSSEAIKREIKIARKKLRKLQQGHPKSPAERETIFLQLVQLELCEMIIRDIHHLF